MSVERSSRRSRGGSGRQHRSGTVELARLLDHLPAAWLVFASDGTVLEAGGQLERLCGGTAEDLIGRKTLPVLADPAPNASPISRAFLTGCTEQQVAHLVDATGQETYVHRTASPIREAGSLPRVIELRVDVSKQLDQGDLRMLS